MNKRYLEYIKDDAQKFIRAAICQNSSQEIANMSTKSGIADRVAKIFQVILETDHPVSLTTIAKGAGIHYRTAQQYIDNGVCDNVLVIGVELLSRFVDYTDRSTCVLFGDGAGAVVLQVSDEPAGVLSSVLGSDGSGAEHLILPAGGTAVPPTHDSIDQGLHTLKMNGNQVFRFASRIIGKALRQVIQEAGLTSDDIDLFIPHQANLRIIESAAKYVGFPEEKIFINIDRYGNTSAATIPTILDEAVRDGRIQKGQLLLVDAFGAGFTYGAMVIRW